MTNGDWTGAKPTYTYSWERCNSSGGECEPVAGAAADAGFSDQSHLTRLFRRTFGTTPGVYWRD